MQQPNRRSIVIDIGTDSDSEFYYSDEEQLDSDFEDIFEQDQDHLDIDKENGYYYIGMHAYIPSRRTMLITNSVSVSTFYKYSYERICGYLYRYSVIRADNPSVDIIKLSVLPDESYSVILKTHWLRIVQRTWKKVYQERQKILINRGNVSEQRYFEIHGQYRKGMNVLPTIHGMLLSYNSFIETQ